MKKFYLAFVALTATLALWFVGGCEGGGGGGVTCSPGFCVVTTEFVVGFDPAPVPSPGINVNGNWVADLPGAVGTRTILSGPQWTTSFTVPAILSVPDGRVPAKWNFGETNGDCGGDTLLSFVTVNPGDAVTLECVVVRSGFQASPASFDHSTLPGSLTISGSGMSEQYGMPSVMVYDMQGNMYYMGSADTCAPDMSWVGLSGQDMAHLPAGSYAIAVGNVLSDGSVQPVGAAQIQVTANNLTPTSLSLIPDNVTMNATDSIQLTAALYYPDGSWVIANYFAIWASSDPSLATVANGGWVTGTGSEMCCFTTITASYQGLQGTALIMVEPATPPPDGA